MKQSIVVIAALLFSNCLSAQQSDSLVWRYSDVTYPLGGFSSKSKVWVDYGETVTGWFKVPDLLEDAAGKAVKFKTPVDALNWMSVRGWELVQSYSAEEDGGLGIRFRYQHFIMRRLEPLKRL